MQEQRVNACGHMYKYVQLYILLYINYKTLARFISFSCQIICVCIKQTTVLLLIRAKQISDSCQIVNCCLSV